MAYENRNYDSTVYPSTDLYRHDSNHSSSREHVSPADSPSSRPRLSRPPFSDRSQNSPCISPQDSQPVKEAVNDHLRRSGATGQLDPSIVAQITEEVRKQVIDSLRGQQPSPKPSPSQSSAEPPRDVYTPPSPSRNESEYSVSPHSPGSPSSSAQDIRRRSSPRERTEQLAKDGGPRAASPLVASDHGSFDATTTTQQPSRSSPYARSTEIEETTIEKTWRPLFDSEGQPTARLSQFLRGLALHLINDYEPRHSLVVTPAKMRKFYDEVRVQDETYCWASLFTSLPNSTISKIYRDLRCEHHLVQDQLIAVPNIPALSPEGFRQWMTLMIQGHPDTEYERLNKAVMNMPISNADDAKERFPKELSRRLFPKTTNTGARQRCATALSINGGISLRTTSFPPPPPPPQPPPSNRPSSQSSGGFSPTTKPSYSQWRAESFDTAAISEDSDNEPPPCLPIERERKPYSAREGSGKIYSDMSSSSRASTSSTASGTTTASSQPFAATDWNNATRVRRAMSTQHNHGSGYQRPKPVFASEYPPNSMQTRNYRTGSTSYGAARRRSPSFSHGSDRFGTRSEPNNVAEIPASYYSSNIYSESGDDDESKNARRFREYESANGRSAYAPANPGRRSSVYEDEQFRKPAVAPTSSSYAAPNPYSSYPPPPPPRYA